MNDRTLESVTLTVKAGVASGATLRRQVPVDANVSIGPVPEGDATCLNDVRVTKFRYGTEDSNIGGPTPLLCHQRDGWNVRAGQVITLTLNNISDVERTVQVVITAGHKPPSE